VSHYHSYINSAKKILELYQGEEPFSSFSKKYFSENKKFGSRDRKQIAHLCYCFFRLGKAAVSWPTEEGILAGLFLNTVVSNEILELLRPEWNKKINSSIMEKFSMLNIQCSTVFPWKEELSEEIEYEKLCYSFFIQPDLFIRIRPRHAETVLLKLDAVRVEYEFISPFTVRLPNSFKIDQHLEIDKEVMVQDYSSQQITGFLTNWQPATSNLQLKVWDCCAASGGKSIMAHDINSNIELTVSDVRESILFNLKKRFERAGIKKYKSFVADLTGNQELATGNYDLIIADVPCTGSGTWGRTPEQLFYFDNKKIDAYASIQKKILGNTIPHLSKDGYLLYITCSVFKKENEENVRYLREKFNLGLVRQETLKGYDKKADTLFAALLKHSL